MKATDHLHQDIPYRNVHQWRILYKTNNDFLFIEVIKELYLQLTLQTKKHT